MAVKLICLSVRPRLKPLVTRQFFRRTPQPITRYSSSGRTFVPTFVKSRFNAYKGFRQVSEKLRCAEHVSLGWIIAVKASIIYHCMVSDSLTSVQCQTETDVSCTVHYSTDTMLQNFLYTTAQTPSLHVVVVNPLKDFTFSYENFRQLRFSPSQYSEIIHSILLILTPMMPL